MAGTRGSSRVEAGLSQPRNESCNEGDVTVPHRPSLNTPDFRPAPQTSDTRVARVPPWHRRTPLGSEWNSSAGAFQSLILCPKRDI